MKLTESLNDFLKKLEQENKELKEDISINDDFKKRELDLQSLLEISDRYSSTEKFLTDMSLEPPETSQVKASAIDKEDENRDEE